MPATGFWLIGLAILVSGAVLFSFNPAQNSFYPFCWFHRSTGLHCPGCGSLRALHQLLRGNVMGALQSNAVLLLALPLLGWNALRVERARRRGRAVVFVRAGWLWFGAGVLIVFTILRNLPWFSWLAPS
jgi:hypothetical protein